MGLLSAIFGKKENVDINSLIAHGAKIIDVRGKEEFTTGHVHKSLNIPLQNIEHSLDTIKRYNKPVVVVCRSGFRSSQAVKTLKKNGIEAHNGGAWQNLA